MHKRFETGKQLYDAAKDTQATAPSHKPADILRLSTRSTRDNPRLLGGTVEEGRAYLDNVEPQQRREYDNFKSIKKKYGTEKAKDMYPVGHAIYIEYMRHYNKQGESSTRYSNQGESSTQSRKTIKQLNEEVIEDYTGYKEELARQAKEWQAHLAETSKKR